MGEMPPKRITCFGEDARLNRRQQIEQVRQGGKSYPGRYAVVVVLKTPPDGMRRAAFLISRRFDLLAVRRNRARRLFRESLRLLFPRMQPCWMLVIPRRLIKGAKCGEVSRELESLLLRAGVLR